MRLALRAHRPTGRIERRQPHPTHAHLPRRAFRTPGTRRFRAAVVHPLEGEAPSSVEPSPSRGERPSSRTIGSEGLSRPTAGRAGCGLASSTGQDPRQDDRQRSTWRMHQPAARSHRLSRRRDRPFQASTALGSLSARTSAPVDRRRSPVQGSKPSAKITSLVAVIEKFGAEMLKKMLPTQDTRTRACVVVTFGTVMFALPLFGNVPTLSG